MSNCLVIERYDNDGMYSTEFDTQDDAREYIGAVVNTLVWEWKHDGVADEKIKEFFKDYVTATSVKYFVVNGKTDSWGVEIVLVKKG